MTNTPTDPSSFQKIIFDRPITVIWCVCFKCIFISLLSTYTRHPRCTTLDRSFSLVSSKRQSNKTKIQTINHCSQQERQPTNQESVDTCCIVMTWRRLTFINLNIACLSNIPSLRTVTPVPASDDKLRQQTN